MSLKERIIVISTLHDPEARLKSLINTRILKIRDLFDKIVVCCTPTTGSDVIDLLNNSMIHVFVNSVMKTLETYKKAIKEALKLIDSNQKLVYIDFDRLLHWSFTYPEELEKILSENLDVAYVHVGRTNRAFETHPITQKDTESIVNQLCSKMLNLERDIDILSACWIFTEKLATKILEMPVESTNGFYCVWPMYMWQLTQSKKYIEVEGLEWETPDRFTNEINGMGYDAWLEQFKTSKEWKRRVNILKDCMRDLIKNWAFFPARLSKN